jgi:3-hydroxyacyl-CoA dehydrogenase
MSDVVTYEREGEVGVMTVKNPPVNALSQAVRQGIMDALEQGENDDGAKILMLVGDGRTYIAGADISEFGKPMQSPDLNTVVNALEECPKPTVAAIHGTALGGGLETALGCHYRVALASASVGVPEVKLGLIPGAGGTQRLPRVGGPQKAVEMTTTGRFVPAAEAKEAGIIDEVADGDDVRQAGLEYARKLVSQSAGTRKTRERGDKLEKLDFDAIRKEVGKKAGGQMSPYKCVDAVQAATELPFWEGLKREREIFTECHDSDQSTALIHAFFAEREVTKIPDVPKDTPKREIKRAAVIGGGTMGGGIAMNFANAGIPVQVLEVKQEALDKGFETIKKNYSRTVSKGRLSQEKMDQRMGLIQGTLSYDDLSDADIVIEAVFEQMDVKEKVFAELDRVCKDGAILASNTSSLDINHIADLTKRPQDVIGTHFFSPANVMKLLEVVRGDKTAKDVIATIMSLAKGIKKVPVLVGVCDGFVGNRMIFQYAREAEFLLLEGALPEQVERVITEFGLPMGPFAMGDMSGNDVMWYIRKRQREELPAEYKLPNLLDKIAEQGRYGQKAGKGWFKYEDGSRKPIPDPEIQAMIEAESKAQGIQRREIPDDEILERTIYPLINEGAQILDEGMALRPGDIDIIYLYGYGFPAYRGGPMCYADIVGVEKVYDRIKHYHEKLGAWWKPAALLQRLVHEGRQFRDLKAVGE